VRESKNRNFGKNYANPSHSSLPFKEILEDNNENLLVFALENSYEYFGYFLIT